MPDFDLRVDTFLLLLDFGSGASWCEHFRAGEMAIRPDLPKQSLGTRPFSLPQEGKEFRNVEAGQETKECW